MSEPTASVRVATDGPVVIVTINRPERRNAVDGHTAGALLEAFTEFAADDALSVAVLTGAGGTFGGSPMATTKTDFSGQATAAFTPNQTSGTSSIKVVASAAWQVAQTRIVQTNSSRAMEATVQTPPRPWYKSGKWWAVIGAGAGGGIATAVVLSGGHTNTITISPGTVTIGGR